jgi:hypothetical protein
MAMRQRVVHVRFAGRSFDVPLATLGATDRTDERRLRESLASYLEVGVGRLDDYVLDRHANGNLTLRPEAIFG